MAAIPDSTSSRSTLPAGATTPIRPPRLKRGGFCTVKCVFIWFVVGITPPLLGHLCITFQASSPRFCLKCNIGKKPLMAQHFFPLVVLLGPDDRALTSLHLAGN